mgnify:FL=1
MSAKTEKLNLPDADSTWNEYIGDTYSSAIKRKSKKFAPRDYLHMRRDRLLALGFNPNDQKVWQMSTETLAEHERIVASIKATGHPDTSWFDATMHLTVNETINWLTELGKS